MEIEHINPKGLSEPTGYTHIVKAGKALYISGQIACDSEKNIVGLGDPEVQTKQIFENLRQCLGTQGIGLDRVVKLTIYVTNSEYISSVRNVRSLYYSPKSEPAATLVVVSALAHPEYLVEIDAIAVLP